MFGLLKVTGDSLYPAYRQGDFVLVTKIPFFLNSILQGDVIVFNHPAYGTLIKCVESVSADHGAYIVLGMHENSVDSRHFGPVDRSAVVGKVIWHISKPVT
jgi:nickel-type superoxide dismutase maturation protease